MTEITEGGALETWSTANCPFTIEYSRRVLDDIRLAVVDAFFSLPRGGAEIGGVLLGKFANGRVTILEYAPLECEHIFGPSFTLSPGDHARLAEMLSAVDHNSDLQPVGWYHSHTRSDIFLSEADLDIHNRYFSAPWQVALILRPSTFQPVQAGFFFREADGAMHARASYQEFALDPLPVGQVPRGMPAAIAQPAHRESAPEGPVITLMADPVAAAPANREPWEQAVAEAAVVPAADPAPPPRTILLPPTLPPLPTLELVPGRGKEDESVPEQFLEPQVAAAPEEVVAPLAVDAPAAPIEAEPLAAVTPPAPADKPAAPETVAEIKLAPQPQLHSERPAAELPSFLQVEPVRSRRWLWVAGAAAVVVAVGAGAFQQRATWLPQQAAAPAAPLTLPLNARDQQGQLQIRWDGASRAVTQARDGILQITDDGATTDLPMDAAHLHGGQFTYVRRGEHIDARLTVQELDGTQVRTVTSFYGPLPALVKPVAADATSSTQNSDLAKKNADLARDNGALQQRLSELTKQTSKLKSDLAARTESGKQNADLVRQNAELRQQLDGLAKQTARLKGALAAQAESGKQNADLAQQNAELRRQRDDLAKQTARLKSDLAARVAANKQNPVQSANFSQQRSALINQVTQLESDLAVATTRADRLARQLEELRKQQLQRRLQNQSGEPSQ